MAGAATEVLPTNLRVGMAPRDSAGLPLTPSMSVACV